MARTATLGTPARTNPALNERVQARLRQKRKRDFFLGLSAVLAFILFLVISGVTGISEVPMSAWPAYFWLLLTATFVLLLAAAITVLPREPTRLGFEFLLAATVPWIITLVSRFRDLGWNFLTLFSALAIICSCFVFGWHFGRMIRFRQEASEARGQRPGLPK